MNKFQQTALLSSITTVGRTKIILLIFVCLITLPLLYYWVPAGDDWKEYFRPATLVMLRGGSPYGSGFYNAPWGLLFFVPIALLPFRLGRLIFFLLSLASFAYIVRKLTSKPVSILLFMTSAPVFLCLDGGNLDWLAMFSFILPAPFALIFAAIKPQVGAGIALYWLYESWRSGGIKTVTRNFLPVSLLLIASFLFYGLWPLNFSAVNSVHWNISFFPYTIPIGIFLLGASILNRKADASMAAGLFLSPYYSIRSLFTLLIPLLEHPKLLLIAWSILWIGVVALAI